MPCKYKMLRGRRPRGVHENVEHGQEMEVSF